jgi:hypothetical protein
MSADLQWLLIRKWNSFMRPAANGPVFSSEKVRNCSKIDRARTFGSGSGRMDLDGQGRSGAGRLFPRGVEVARRRSGATRGAVEAQREVLLLREGSVICAEVWRRADLRGLADSKCLGLV